ncbi:NUDIX domain-containing protein [Variovorax sp.]|uniref:NUDIX domain-containing protein n=1 Tax=Variovorax sp. TaxID=1871043 RepID=UPI003BAA413A
MNATPPKPRPIRTAASLILLRDGPGGLEVLMLRRADKPDDQNSGASVFPGGVVDAHDRELHTRCAGLDDAAASARLALPAGGLDYYAAAVRECFEEAGVLFANDADGALVALDRIDPERLAAMRAAVADSTEALLALCDAQGWRLAVDQFAYFSHWLTPPGMPRRFDTRFFVAAMPPGQEVQVDGFEIVEHRWLPPAEAASPALGLKLMNVTRRVLLELAGFASVTDCLAQARARARVRLNMPRLADGPEGRRPVNVDEAPYDEVALVDPDGQGGGRYAHEAGLSMRLSARVWRVTGADGTHSHFVGGDEGWALIDPVPGEALRAAAPGPVRWVLATRGEASAAGWPDARVLAPQPGESLDLGGATLEVLGGDEECARRFLLVEERMLFSGSAQGAAVAWPEDAAVEWIAPVHGFVARHAPD